MTEVHRYKAVQLISMGGARIGYDPHGPDVVMAAAYDEQRAQLAEALLLAEKVRDAVPGMQRKYLSDLIVYLCQGSERTAISATAEPSAPVAPYPNRLCHIDYTAHPHRCGCLKGDEESQRIYDEHFSKGTAEPSAPVELSAWQLESER